MSEHTPSRRTVVRTAAWTVPAVAVVAAAPAAFAATPVDAPNLSTSLGKTSTRSGKNVTVPAATLKNSGGVAAQGLSVNVQTGVAVTAVTALGLPVSTFGITITPPLPQTNFTLTVPAGTNLGQVTIAPGGEYTAPVNQVFAFQTNVATTFKTITTAGNGGVPFAPPQVTV